MKKLGYAVMLAMLAATPALAHQNFMPRDEVIHNTPEWKGERFADGRPRVADAILDRMKNVTLEEAWATLRNAGHRGPHPFAAAEGHGTEAHFRDDEAGVA